MTFDLIMTNIRQIYCHVGNVQPLFENMHDENKIKKLIISMMNFELGNHIQKEGWLHKRGEHIKTWRSRYFILKNNGDFLGFNFKPTKNDIPNNTFCLRQCQITISEKLRMNSFALKIKNNDDKIIERFFAANSSNERNEWICAIRFVTQSICHNMSADQSKNDKIVNFVEIFFSILFKINSKELNDFEYLKIIGKGHFGKVVLTREKCSGRILAMKILKKNLIIEQVVFKFYLKNILIFIKKIE